MAKKEAKNLNNVPIIELEKELAEERQKLVDLKFNLAAGKVKNIKEVKKTKVRIAQILTAKNARKEN
ncbi:50S ribosomal protein L29 [Patescibacteria group bacterium]|jgi:ribosomal protein L29|nr:50S ribosomal protein L29 [Patescibacteria group bacterium]MCL5114769.1 50S ribosomal protein L29 [Patescibacteria group bacterium]